MAPIFPVRKAYPGVLANDDVSLTLHATRGMEYNPLTRRYALSADTSVNYLLASRRPG